MDAYYDVALTILDGDAGSLLALAGKLPDEAKKTELLAFHERRTREAAAAAAAAEAEAAAAARAAALAAEAESTARRLDRVASLRPLAPIHRVDSNASIASSDRSAKTDDEHIDELADAADATDASSNDVMRELFADEDDEDCCPVCLDARVTVQCVPCSHALCGGCFELWRLTNASFYAVAKNGASATATTCPMCRAPIAGFTARVASTATGRKKRDAGGAEGGAVGVGAVVAKKKESRGARARRKARERAESDAAGDDGFGPADYRAYGDSWVSQEQSGRNPEGIRKASGCERIDADDADSPIVVWFRQDLRVRDNPALHAAARTGRPVVTCFAWCPGEDGGWPMGGATRYWLHRALLSLQASLRARYGGDLVVRDATGNGNVTGNVTGNGCGTSSSSSSSFDELAAVVRECGAKDVYCNRVYEPWKIARDGECERRFAAELNVRFRSFNAGVLYEPWDARPDATDDACWNSGYGSVRFFLRGCARLGEPPPPLPPPPTMRVRLPAERRARSVGVDALRLARMPRRGKGGGTNGGSIIDWAAGIRDAWTFGEDGAVASLREFLNDGSLERFDAKSARTYSEHGGGSIGGEHKNGQSNAPKASTERFRADVRTTARISPYVRHGELSPREVYHSAKAIQVGSRRSRARSAAVFLRRLAWRDLAYWSLWRFPRLCDEPLRPQYATQWWALPWDPAGRGDSVPRAVAVRNKRWHEGMVASSDDALRAWQFGRTGYPLVDAGMRELWATGYVPNYIRHVVAGFLIEYLNVDWRHGQLWFHDCLVDADVAIQGFMWQNGGHSGMDQWNFVMHPVYAAKSADPEGAYVRRWCPELAGLPREFVHCPWEAPATTLAAAGVALGRDYPKRIVSDLEDARRKSLKAVVDVRRAHPEYVLPDGNEALPLPEPGRTARCITRVDYRMMSEEVVTRQTAAAPWDASRRQRRDPMSRALDDAAALSERIARDAASVLG